MIKYIVNKGEKGEHQTVEVPERILSNFDRRAYEPVSEMVDLDEFLTEAYRRRLKDVNSKWVHTENEKIRKSKRTSDLNLYRGSACIR